MFGMFDKKIKILKKILTECYKHKEMLKYLLNKIEIPITEEKIKYIDLKEKTMIDSLIFRFSKLQDRLAKIFYILLQILGEDTDNLAFIDILNKMEKLNIIPSTEKYLELRKLRNVVIHEYELNQLLLVEELNKLIENVSILLDIYENILKFIYQRNLFKN
jgi:uncharacterized protein YutE (UPF0331/DUF86 family)